MKIKFDDSKRELLDLFDKKMAKVRHETRGALAHQLKFIEEASS